jgi:hypothetical protein
MYVVVAIRAEAERMRVFRWTVFNYHSHFSLCYYHARIIDAGYVAAFVEISRFVAEDLNGI